MGPIETTVVITAAEVQEWLGLATLPDIVTGMYALLLTTAKQLADQFCNNTFLNDDDTPIVVIPDAVKMGVLQVLTDLHNSWKKSKGETPVSGSVTKEKVGDVEVNYSTGAGAATSKSAAMISEYAKGILSVYRLMPL